MATSSLTKKFVITDKTVADKLHCNMKSLHPVQVKHRSIEKESRKGIDLLKRSLSS